MPVEERSTRSLERCDQHPSRPSVGRCEGCGRPLCLSCAVPVRGALFGAECLPERIGGEPAAGPAPESSGPRVAIAVGLGLCLLGTALPWSRVGPDSGAFGAWGGPPRWASLTAAAAVLGVALWLVARFTRLVPERGADVALAVLGALAALGAALAAWHPPAFTSVWLGAWVSVLGGLGACAAAIGDARERTGAAAKRI